MKNIFIKTFVSITLLFYFINPLIAQDLSKLKIGTVNMQEALNTSVIGQQSRAKIEQEIKSKTAEFNAREERIIKLRNEIENGLLNNEAKKEKLSELEKLQNQYIRDRQVTDNEIKSIEQKYTAEVFNDLKKIINDYAKSNKYDHIIEYSLYSTILYSKLPVTDITKDIISKYDEDATKNN